MGFESELNRSISTLLNGNVGSGIGVYDAPGKTSSYPYIVIGDYTSISDDTDNTIGRDIVATIHIWDNYNGFKRVRDLAGVIDGLMNRANFSVTGYDLIDCVFDSSDFFDDRDGKTRHGVVSFRILLDGV